MVPGATMKEGRLSLTRATIFPIGSYTLNETSAVPSAPNWSSTVTTTPWFPTGRSVSTMVLPSARSDPSRSVQLTVPLKGWSSVTLAVNITGAPNFMKLPSAGFSNVTTGRLFTVNCNDTDSYPLPCQYRAFNTCVPGMAGARSSEMSPIPVPSISHSTG